MQLKNNLSYLLVLLFCYQGFCQDNEYREDQFYFGVSYVLLTQMPKDMAQNGFSSGFQIGFIRDMPFNDKRTWALGLGAGLSANSINQNLQIIENDQNEIEYAIVDNGSFTKNKFSLNLIEFPLEIRWRNSTPETYKFFRIYGGFKLGYVFASTVKFKGDPKNYKISGVEDFNRWQYGLTLSLGYDKFNVNLYYPLNSVFKNEAQLNGEQLDISTLKIGMLLYIL